MALVVAVCRFLGTEERRTWWRESERECVGGQRKLTRTGLLLSMARQGGDDDRRVFGASKRVLECRRRVGGRLDLHRTLARFVSKMVRGYSFASGFQSCEEGTRWVR
jgi:hypothetical protein